MVYKFFDKKSTGSGIVNNNNNNNNNNNDNNNNINNNYLHREIRAFSQNV